MRTGFLVAVAVLGGAAFLVPNCVSFATVVRRPPPESADVLADDRLADKTPQPFDPARVYDVPCGDDGAWIENRSEAVIRLDVPMVRADTQRNQLVLHASYAEAVAADAGHVPILPSINAVDGKAKQFDDGLVAALDLATFDGIPGKLVGRVAIVRRLAEAVGTASAATPFLAAALELAGAPLAGVDRGAVGALLDEFAADEVNSKPIAFYTWNDRLARVWRFTRFLQRRFPPASFPGAADLRAALASDRELRDAYARTVGIDRGLHDPAACASLLELGEDARALALLPPASSREVELCRRILAGGLAAGTNLMTELVRRIRAGEVDLAPRQDSGWLDRQVFALETLLLPERADERDHLLLTAAYKRRMLEAFQALLVKRLETHAVSVLGSAAPTPPAGLPPALRVEPCATYALRTARAYAFLEAFLVSTLGADTLATLRGLRQDGERATDLASELRAMRDLFYGIHLVSAADVGMAPSIAGDEPVDRDACRAVALAWLRDAYADPDLAVDTRVGVPFRDGQQTRLWATLGVRLTRLDVSWARPPRVRLADGSGGWEEVPGGRIVYALPVDDFAEVTLAGSRSLTREELRAMCGSGRTRAEIVAALE